MSSIINTGQWIKIFPVRAGGKFSSGKDFQLNSIRQLIFVKSYDTEGAWWYTAVCEQVLIKIRIL